MADSGAGSRLPTVVLTLAGVSTVVAVFVSMMSIMLQLRNYRKPALQRYFSRLVLYIITKIFTHFALARLVVRIMIMVPLYAISSLISLFSLGAAFVNDAIRDIYEVGHSLKSLIRKTRQGASESIYKKDPVLAPLAGGLSLHFPDLFSISSVLNVLNIVHSS